MVLTFGQREALYRLWERSRDDNRSYLTFRRKVFSGFMGEVAMVPWCGMIIGIEKDGYIHS